MHTVDLSHLERRRIRCAVCDANESVGLHENCGLRIERCSGCGLVFVNPQPTADALRRYYGTDQLESAQTWESYFRHPQHQIEALWRERLDDMTRRLGRPGGKLLDIGCGWGDFMHYARERGYEVQGFEFSQVVATVAREKYKLDVAVGDIWDLEFADDAFDIVTMWHVLEHVSEPLDVLQRIERLLKPGGTLIVEVPNLHFIACRSFVYPLSETLHLFHYNRDTLSAILEKGCFVVRSCRPGNTGYQSYGTAKLVAKRAIYGLNAVVFGLTGWNIGDAIRAYAQKPERAADRA